MYLFYIDSDSNVLYSEYNTVSHENCSLFCSIWLYAFILLVKNVKFVKMTWIKSHLILLFWWYFKAATHQYDPNIKPQLFSMIQFICKFSQLFFSFRVTKKKNLPKILLFKSLIFWFKYDSKTLINWIIILHIILIAVMFA